MTISYRNRLPAKALFATGSLIALGAALALPNLAAAQDAAAVGEVVVTASRIQAAGFTAPTPTTVLGTTELTRRAPVTVQETLAELPSLRGSTSPQQSSSPTNGANSGAGGSLVDMRGLGNARTLLLVDGHRTGASNDLRQFPTIMVQRIDVVTGGASAAYGSDAVSGVVNVVLDNKFNGLKGQAQAGVTKYGDDKSFTGALAWGGRFFDDRAHLLIGGEYSTSNGAHTTQNVKEDKRPWFAANRGLQLANPCPINVPISSLPASCGGANNGLPAFVDTDDKNFATMNPGGVIVSGPLKGITFEDGGIPRQFQYGTVLGNLQIGGEGTNPSMWWSRPKEDRYTLLAHLDFQLTDRVELWLEYGNAQTKNAVTAVRARDQGNLTIRRENAFMPTVIRDRMVALNLTTLTMGRFNNDGGQPWSYINTDIYRWAGGLRGDLGGSWGWDAYFQYGVLNQHNKTVGSRNQARWLQAIDSVVNAQGVPVCRNPAGGCVPFNVFGPNAASQAARDFVFGTQSSDERESQTNAQINLHGEPISTWAGPVALAVGGEYRKQTRWALGDPIARTGGWDSGNTRLSQGEFDVKEAYAEVAIPLARDMAVAKTLDFNGAIRYADYSSVRKGVTTWKFGGTWEPIDEILVRATYSQDTRAPNINELFAPGGTSRNNIVQFSGPNAGVSGLIDYVSGGNPNLRPETGRTFTAGVTLRPKFTRLRLSTDYYEIKIKDQIGTVGVQNIVDLCRDGDRDACALITFEANRNIIAVLNTNVNNARWISRGLDFELSYTQPLDEIWSALHGTLTGRALATRTIEHARIDISGYDNKAGQNAGGVIAGEASNMPKWVANYALQYQVDRLTVGIQFRYISPGVLQSRSITGTATERLNNKIGSQTVTNFSANYVLIDNDGRRLQLFGAINNAFNRGPPFPIYPVTQWPAFYDTLGMQMRAGVRFQY